MFPKRIINLATDIVQVEGQLWKTEGFSDWLQMKAGRFLLFNLIAKTTGHVIKWEHFHPYAAFFLA